jgi:hypothetical protein
MSSTSSAWEVRGTMGYFWSVLYERNAGRCSLTWYYMLGVVLPSVKRWQLNRKMCWPIELLTAPWSAMWDIYFDWNNSYYSVVCLWMWNLKDDWLPLGLQRRWSGRLVVVVVELFWCCFVLRKSDFITLAIVRVEILRFFSATKWYEAGGDDKLKIFDLALRLYTRSRKSRNCGQGLADDRPRDW